MARMMLNEHRTPRRFWAEAVNTVCYVSNGIFIRAFKKKTCYDMMHGRTPKVSHFHVFGCKCFILKKDKNLDKFDARSVDGIFFGCATHSRAFHVLNLETNQIVETCEVTFDETQPRSSLVFDCAGDDEFGEEIFQEEEPEHGDDEDGCVVPAAKHVPTTSTTIENGPSPTPTTTIPDQGEAAVEKEIPSRREPPGEFKLIIQLRGSPGISTNGLLGRGFETVLTLLMLLLSLPLSPNTLDMPYLILIRSMQFMRS
jgi:hypothetical protein